MQRNICLFLSFITIIALKYNFAIAKALIGDNIEQVNQGLEFVVCFLTKHHEVLASNIYCTGTLISHEFVLTAEHCFINLPREGFQVQIGSFDIRLATTYYSAWWFSYSQWMKMQKKRARYVSNDIAIMKLSTSVSDNIVPAILSIAPNRDIFGCIAMTAGWGRINTGAMPEIMRKVSVVILTNEECAELATKLEGKTFFITHAEICSIAEPFAQLEVGDSGGPLLIGNIIVGVNMGKVPEMENVFHPEKANIHSSIYFYRNFLNVSTNM